MWRLTKSKDLCQFTYTLILSKPRRIVENALGHSFLHFLGEMRSFLLHADNEQLTSRKNRDYILNCQLHMAKSTDLLRFCTLFDVIFHPTHAAEMANALRRVSTSPIGD